MGDNGRGEHSAHSHGGNQLVGIVAVLSTHASYSGTTVGCVCHVLVRRLLMLH